MHRLPFSNKVALITGGARGIGAAIARGFSREGADVVINYRKAGGASQKRGENLCREMEVSGIRSLLIQADISKKESVRSLLQETVERFGRLDFLILNAARAPFKPMERLLERELKDLVDTNFLGNIFCIQEALSLLEKSRGKIVFISSLGSRFFNPSYPLGSMKAAMETVVRDCAESLSGTGISVNAVCGGIVKTDSFKVLRQHMEEIEHISDKLIVETDEIAEVVLFLCSDASKGIRGQTIVVDRGLSNRLYRFPQGE
jgi:NAD(P)-dependent dehydrogenase (short-subunit alcohol dehydrogenase family)